MLLKLSVCRRMINLEVFVRVGSNSNLKASAARIACKRLSRRGGVLQGHYPD